MLPGYPGHPEGLGRVRPLAHESRRGPDQVVENLFFQNHLVSYWGLDILKSK
jgi:hypothetical protein